MERSYLCERKVLRSWKSLFEFEGGGRKEYEREEVGLEGRLWILRWL